MAIQTFGAALGSLILRKRKVLGLTQTQLAQDAFGTSGKTRRISELENGIVANPNPRTIDPIISILHISETELAECANQTKFQPDADLDRAYREARNLIEATARQFEHSNPKATLAELDGYLRAKAKEWVELRERIQHIESTDSSLSNLKSAAADELAQGNFDEVDLLLSRAEDIQQQARTLAEVRTQSKIRITRGDICLFRGDPEGALTFYSSAAEFFRPFDESEMVHLLERLAERVYEVGLRSLRPSFFVAAALLKTALLSKAVQGIVKNEARLNFRLGLVYRRAYEAGHVANGSDYLSKAIECSRAALRGAIVEADPYRIASAKGGLGNCLIDQAKKNKDEAVLHEAIILLREIQVELKDDENAARLLAAACNSLGGALLVSCELQGKDPTDDILAEAFEAFSGAVFAAEVSLNAEVWGGAKANCGMVLSARAKLKPVGSDDANFLRIQAIAAYLAAIENYPSVLFPLHYAEAHIGLARVLYAHAFNPENELTEFNLLRAIASCESAGSVFSEELHPLRWAEIQMYAGSIFASHAGIDGVKSAKTDLQQAKTRFQSALRIFKENGCTSEVAFCKQALARIKK